MTDSYTIVQTTDPEVFDVFSAKMAVSDPWSTLGMNIAACRAGFEGPCREVFVARWNGEPAGLAILQVCGSFDGYIQILFIVEAFRGRGLGKRLLTFCEDRIFKRSPNVFICVSGFNTRALGLYEATGYTVVGKLKDFLKKGFDELLLRKTVGPRLGYNK
ncbi:MAG TPA: GNAT family N-acetyltransferase [Puia sp.]|nr:GNAT family N-acetyltransferase [Puia sp.]